MYSTQIYIIYVQSKTAYDIYIYICVYVNYTYQLGMQRLCPCCVLLHAGCGLQSPPVHLS
jgi:hypothetical protein